MANPVIVSSALIRRSWKQKGDTGLVAADAFRRAASHLTNLQSEYWLCSCYSVLLCAVAFVVSIRTRLQKHFQLWMCSSWKTAPASRELLFNAPTLISLQTGGEEIWLESQNRLRSVRKILSHQFIDARLSKSPSRCNLNTSIKCCERQNEDEEAAQKHKSTNQNRHKHLSALWPLQVFSSGVLEPVNEVWAGLHRFSVQDPLLFEGLKTEFQL